LRAARVLRVLSRAQGDFWIAGALVSASRNGMRGADLSRERDASHTGVLGARDNPASGLGFAGPLIAELIAFVSLNPSQ
jgi:hypothetical protein